MDQGTRVGQSSSGEIKKLDEIYYVVSARDDIWVTVVIHQDCILAEKLAISPETVGTVRIVASLVI